MMVKGLGLLPGQRKSNRELKSRVNFLPRVLMQGF